jgi:hypothetical protein
MSPPSSVSRQLPTTQKQIWVRAVPFRKLAADLRDSVGLVASRRTAASDVSPGLFLGGLPMRRQRR